MLASGQDSQNLFCSVERSTKLSQAVPQGFVPATSPHKSHKSYVRVVHCPNLIILNVDVFYWFLCFGPNLKEK